MPDAYAALADELGSLPGTVEGFRRGGELAEILLPAVEEWLDHPSAEDTPDMIAVAGAIAGECGNALMQYGEIRNDATLLQLAVAAFDLALRGFPKDAAPEDWATAHINRATTLVSLATLCEGRQGERLIGEAIASYEAGLTVRTPESMPAPWARTMSYLASAQSILGEMMGGSGGIALLEAAVVGHDAAWEALPEDVDHGDRVRIMTDRAAARLRLGSVKGAADGAAHLTDAIHDYDMLLAVCDPDALPEDRAQLHINRANALGDLAAHLSGPDREARLRAAVAGYDTALDGLSAAVFPADWAAALVSRANVSTELAHILRGDEASQALRSAIADCGSALTVLSRQDAPAIWALAHTNRANALAILADRQGGEAAVRWLQAAIADYDAGLEVRTRKDMAFRWATTQMNRANALERLGSLTDGEAGTAGLRAAISGYDAALTALDPDRHPENWAWTQMNRANALQALGNIEGGRRGIDLLHAAVAGYDAALTVQTLHGMPVHWARTHMNRGNALRRLADLTGGFEGVALLRNALADFDDSLTVRTPEAAPLEWAGSQLNRANALVDLAALTDGADERTLLDAAVDACGAALSVLDQSSTPVEWLRAQMVRSGARLRLGTRSVGAGSAVMLRSAIDGYDEVLSAMVPDSMPMAWSMAQANRAGALFALSTKRSSPEALTVLRQAIDGFEAALTRRSRYAAPAHWTSTQRNRAFALRQLGRSSTGPERNACFSTAAALFADLAGLHDREGRLTERFVMIGGLTSCLLRLQDWEPAARHAREALSQADALLLETAAEYDLSERVGALGGLSDAAAFSLARLNRLPEAVLLLEAGRARQLRDHVRLTEARLPDTGRSRLEAARRELGAARQRCQETTELWSAFDDPGGRAGRERQWEMAVSELRAAHQAFLATLRALGLDELDLPSVTLLDKVADMCGSDGAIVMIAVTEVGGVAFVLRQGPQQRADIGLVDLPDFGLGDMDALLQTEQGTGWLDGFEAFQTDLRTTAGLGSAAGLEAWNDRISQTLNTLWDRLMRPIDDALRRCGLPDGAGITLVVPGRLSILPLHGAGCRDETRWRCFIDRWPVTYAPSLTAAIRSLQWRGVPSSSPDDESPSLLSVLDPTNDLMAESLEANRWLPAGSTLAGSRAGRARVLAALPQHDYAIFACHGRWDPQHRNRSGLILANGELLTPADLAASNLGRCRLVMLGACESALSSIRTAPDEHHGLPLAFLQAGVRAVAATFWPLFTTTANAIVNHTFREHRHGGAKPAAALRSAVLAMRDAPPSCQTRDPAPHFPITSDGERTDDDEATARRTVMIGDFSQPIHWAVYGLFGG